MVKKAAWWCLGLGGVLAVLNAVSVALPPLSTREYLAAVEDAGRVRPSIITVGHSRSRAVDFHTLGVPGRHLYYSGSDLAETRYLLSGLVRKLPTLEVVLIPLSPFESFHDNSRTRPVFRFEVLRIGHRLGASGTVQGDWRNAILARAFEMVRADHWTKALLPLSRSPRTMHAPLQDRCSRSGCSKEEVEAHIRALIGGSDLEPSTVEENLSRTLAAIRSIRDDLLAQGIRVVFYNAPVPALTRQVAGQLGAEAGVDFEGVAQELDRDLREIGIQVLDFSTDPILCEDLGLYGDPTHLNRWGAVRFSGLLREKLGDLGGLPLAERAAGGGSGGNGP